MENDPLTKKVVKELKSYMEGKHMEFELPIEMEGTPFQNAVWKALLKIPAGQTKTYGQIATMIKRPKAARAVGNALNANPICIVVPCHRVTASNGLGGYAFGLPMKKWLLSHEGAQI